MQDGLAQLAARLGKTVQLRALLSRWESLVREVERGYELTYYDYTNDLSIRDRLEELLAILPAGAAAKLSRAMSFADDKFAAATDEVRDPLLDRSGSWWKRIPRRRDPEFDTGLTGGNRIVK